MGDTQTMLVPFTPLEMPRTEARGKLKNSYTFSQGVNAPWKILLTGFASVSKVLGAAGQRDIPTTYFTINQDLRGRIFSLVHRLVSTVNK